VRRFLLSALLFPTVGAAQTAPAGSVHDAAEVMPAIVGGAAALASAVIYPEQAWREGVEGTVVVRFVVDAHGEASQAEVLRTPSPSLADAALAAIDSTRFTSGTIGGQAVAVRMTVPIRFRLPSGGLPPVLLAPSEPEVYEVAEVPPVLIGGTEGLQRHLEYPVEARRNGIQGMVVVQFVVGTEGQVEDPVVLRSAHPLLDAAALAAVRGSRFTPGVQDGVPVRVLFAVPIQYRLR